MFSPARCLTCALVIALVSASPALAAPTFEILDLGPTTQGDWEQMSLWVVNNAGQAVGDYRDTTDSTWGAMVWDNGTFHPLPGLGGDDEGGSDINDAGAVCGYGHKLTANGSGPEATGDAWSAVVWTDSNSDGVADQVHDAGIPLGGTDASGDAINSSGHVAGYSEATDGSYGAYLWKDLNGNWTMDDGEITPLGSLSEGGDSDAADINAHDVVCGEATGDDGKNHPFVWSEATGMVGLGLLPDTATHDYQSGQARGINDDGTVVGFIGYQPQPGVYGLGSGQVAVMWTDNDGDGVADPGTITELPRLGGPSSMAFAVNNLGQIVGDSRIAGGGDYSRHAFLYEDGVTYDLNDLILNGAGWTIYYAVDISDTGYVVGGADLAGGSPHVFRLNTPVIAEPLTMTAVLIGLGAAAGRLRRRLRR